MAQVHIGASEYLTVKAAFDAINAGTHTGAIVITISSSTTETATAQLNASGSGSANYTSILIYPSATGVSVTGSLSSALIYLFGADNVTVDGRVNQSGNMDMIIENSSTSSSACALYFNYDACNNIITYANIKASPASTGSYPTSSTRAVIYFGSLSSVTGQDNNTISYSNIGPSGSNLPVYGILSYGSSTAGRENSANTIDQCNIFDYFHNYSTGSSSSSFDAGIYLYYYGNDEWIITNNSFYQTATRNKSNINTYNNIAAIFIRCGDGHVIAGNYIGGSAPQCAGDKMTYTGNAYEFHVIKVNGNIPSTNAIEIYDNVIKNISFTSSTTNSSTNNSVPRFSALHFGKGKISCYNNTIGSTTENNSIELHQTNTTFSMYDIWVPAAYSNYVVEIEKCNSNTIAGITIDAPYFDAKGIHIENYTGNTVDSVCYNTIGSTTLQENFQIALNTASVTRSYFVGIYTGGLSSGTRIFEGNTVCNVAQGSGGTSSIVGMSINAYDATIANNTIKNIESDNTGTMYGLSASYQNANLYGNYIANIGSSASSSNYVVAIYNTSSTGTSEIYNNIVSLGLDANGNSYESRSFRGIMIRYSSNIKFNTVSIQGECTSNNSYAYYDYFNSSSRLIKDNIFSNERSNTAGTAKHYAAYFYSTSGLTVDYNDYYASGTGAVLGYLSGDRSTLATIQSATGQDANSVNTDPDFYNTGGNYASDLMLLSSLNGTAIAGLTTDFAGITRNATPTIGAWEYKTFVWKGTVNTDFNTAGNWLDSEVPPMGASIIFDASPLNNCFLDQNRTVADLTNAQSTYNLFLNGHSLCIRGSLIFSNSATIDAGTVGSEAVFCGSSAQIIPTGAFDANDVYNLSINNPFGVSMETDLNINNQLTLSSGILKTNANLLTIEDNVTVSGASSDNYINGNCRKIGNDAFVFPIGNIDKYAPIEISAPSVITDHYTASFFYANPNPSYSVSSLEIGIDHVSTNEYWILDRTSGSSSVDVTMYWNAISGISDMGNLRVARWDGSQWTDEGNVSTTGTTTSGTILSNTISDFSPFTFGSATAGNPLPVEFISVNASAAEKYINIEWVTASEFNNDYFAVEKSLDCINWSEIAYVLASGNSNYMQSYLVVDMNPNNGMQYYRIVQTDFNGSTSYSSTVFVKWQKLATVTLFPNPASNGMIINFGTADVVNATLRIMNASGDVVQIVENVANMTRVDIRSLSAGMYFIDFPENENYKKTKFIKK